MKMILYNFIFLNIFFIASQSLVAQHNDIVQVEFEIDGSRSLCNFSEIDLLLSINGQKVRPILLVNGFIIPDTEEKEIDVYFVYKNKTYFFPKVHRSKFSGKWVFGVDKIPFKQLYQTNMKGVKTVRFITFSPVESLETTYFIMKKKNT